MADLHVTEAEIFLLPSPLQDSDRLAQEEARRIQQHQHNNKMTDYSERVLKPRQNSLLQRKTERQHSMAGEAWRLTQGFPVGGAEDQVCPDVAVDESANQGARRRRTLLQTVTPDPARTNATHALKQKKVIVLPDEPPEDAEGVSGPEPDPEIQHDIRHFLL
ncbi:UBX domain-containing protein [Pimephales promelas]|nr:UBX domain-containing protein [Pimephales promelas]